MKEYNVCGIGNALVDLDFEVSVATLERLHIEKGLMTLIDEDKHHQLLEELDGVKHLRACGGSAGNTIYTLQQLGGKSFYSCKIGNDDAGDFFYRDLATNGIHTNILDQPRTGITGKCIVLVTPDADRTMNTFLGTTAEFSRFNLSEAAIKNSEYLYIEGYLVASASGCEAAIIARNWADEHKVKTAISLSDPNMIKYFRSGFDAIIQNQIDILFCNEQEALLFTNTDNLEAAQKELKKIAKTYAITLGSKGAVVYNGKESNHILAYKVKVVDTVGAGDVFAGAFLYGLTNGSSYFEAGDLASFAASKVVAKFGPRLNQQEITEVKENFVTELEKEKELA